MSLIISNFDAEHCSPFSRITLQELISVYCQQGILATFPYNSIIVVFNLTSIPYLVIKGGRPCAAALPSISYCLSWTSFQQQRHSWRSVSQQGYWFIARLEATHTHQHNWKSKHQAFVSCIPENWVKVRWKRWKVMSAYSGITLTTRWHHMHHCT